MGRTGMTGDRYVRAMRTAEDAKEVGAALISRYCCASKHHALRALHALRAIHAPSVV
jgi:hypothetical protein